MSRRAFTLVELLVVISIIAIISTIAVVSMTSARSKSRDTKRMADIHQIITAMQAYNIDNGSYPDTIALGCSCGHTAATACCLGKANSAGCWGGASVWCAALDNALQPYMTNIPDDPENAVGYYGDAYVYYDSHMTGWVTPGPAIHWGYDQVSNSNNCLGGVFGQWGTGGRNRYWCALTLTP
jgi:prepilin-type N-terminal cleavage/methylation domain-containing protein